MSTVALTIFPPVWMDVGGADEEFEKRYDGEAVEELFVLCARSQRTVEAKIKQLGPAVHDKLKDDMIQWSMCFMAVELLRFLEQ